MIDLLIAAVIGFVFGTLFGVFLIALLIGSDSRRHRNNKQE